MDTDLVVRAQHGDKVAYASLATEIADRFLAVSRRILRDIDLAEDATQQALLAIWQDLPQLRDPARFDAWSYRLLVRIGRRGPSRSSSRTDGAPRTAPSTRGTLRTLGSAMCSSRPGS